MPFNNGHIKPLRRGGSASDPEQVTYWFGSHCRTETFVSVRVPVLGHMYVNRRVAEGFVGVMSSIAEAGRESLIDRGDYGGTYACRQVRGSRARSPHSWAIACDLNVNHLMRNGKEGRYGSNFHCSPAEVPETCRQLAPFFEAWGFSWGGYWNTRYLDPTHYEATEYTIKLLEGGSIPTEVQRCIDAAREAAGAVQHVRPYAPGPVKIIDQRTEEPHVIECGAELRDDGQTWVDQGLLLSGLDYPAGPAGVAVPIRAAVADLPVRVVDHIPDQRKVYIIGQ